MNRKFLHHQNMFINLSNFAGITFEDNKATINYKLEPAISNYENRLIIQDMEPLFLLENDKHNITKVTWSPDGNLIAGIKDNTIVCIWNADYGYLEKELYREEDRHLLFGIVEQEDTDVLSVKTISWSSDSKYLAVGYVETNSYHASNSGRIYIWDLEAGELKHKLTTTGAILSLDWCNDSKHLAYIGFYSGYGDVSEPELTIWNVETQEELGSIQVERPLSLAWHPRHPFLAVANETTATIYDLTTSQIVSEWDFQVKRRGRASEQDTLKSSMLYERKIVLNPVGDEIAIGLDNHISFRHLFNGTEMRNFRVDNWRDFCWGLDGELFVVLMNTSIQLYRTDIGNLLWQLHSTDVGESCYWRPSSDNLVVTKSDYKVGVWHVRIIRDNRYTQTEMKMNTIRIGKHIININLTKSFIITNNSIQVIFEGSQLEIYGDKEVKILSAWLKENSIDIETWYFLQSQQERKTVQNIGQQQSSETTQNPTLPDDDLPF